MKPSNTPVQKPSEHDRHLAEVAVQRRKEREARAARPVSKNAPVKVKVRLPNGVLVVAPRKAA